MKALVVDDSRAMRRIIARYAQDLGFEVHEAASGLDALVSAPKIPGLQLIRHQGRA